MSQPPLNALRTSEALTWTGSFRADAAALCVTKSGVNHQMTYLD